MKGAKCKRGAWSDTNYQKLSFNVGVVTDRGGAKGDICRTISASLGTLDAVRNLCGWNRKDLRSN